MISPKYNRQGFIPSFPVKIRNSSPRVHYRNSSMLIAIDHFKKQLIRLETKKKIKAFTEKPKTFSPPRNNSVRRIDLSICLSPHSIQNSPTASTYIAPVIPITTRHALPPIRTQKKLVVLLEKPELMCVSYRAEMASQRSQVKTLKLSKSHKIQQVPDGNERNGTKQLRRKPILLKKKFDLPDESNSSPSPIWDPTLLENI